MAAVLGDRQRMAAPGHSERRPTSLTIQESGGVRKTVERAAAEIAKILPGANDVRRTKQPISELVLATNCGGSDGNSGVPVHRSSWPQTRSSTGTWKRTWTSTAA